MEAQRKTAKENSYEKTLSNTTIENHYKKLLWNTTIETTKEHSLAPPG